jgi:hypothetical protein
MANLDKTTVPECEALPRSGTITAIDSVNHMMDVQIGETLHEAVPVHYHCVNDWKNHTHPHTASEQTQMLAAFKVDDQVLVLCNDEGIPLYVTGFLENPKSCAPIIALFKLIGEEYDWWFWDLNENVGYHQNPNAALPPTPEIISKWWSCEDLEEVEYYTRATPALQAVDIQGCGDECGLINFDNGECCDAPAGADDDNDEWYLCPCGGVGQGSTYNGTICKKMVGCSAGCEPGTQELNYAGAKSTQNRTGNQSTTCPLGHSWGVNIGSLSERIDIGPRVSIAGGEASDVCTLTDAQCTTQSVLFACMDFDPGECACTTWYDPQFVGYECGSEHCSGWWQHANGYYHKWWFGAFGHGTTFQGCIDYSREQKSGSYGTLSAGVVTRVAVGEKETIFDGSWSQYTFGGTSAEGDFTHGWTTTCITCSDSGELGEAAQKGEYAFSETSYGIAGWSTVALDDGRFAVLIPMLVLSASAVSDDDSTTGSITSTTEALLRIVEADEKEFGFGEESSNYALIGMPGSRDDLGIKPNCYPRDIPLDINLRAFHWHELYDWILTAFVMGGVYKAGIAKKIDNAWQLEELAAFKAWVAMNELEEHTAFLN